MGLIRREVQPQLKPATHSTRAEAAMLITELLSNNKEGVGAAQNP